MKILTIVMLIRELVNSSQNSVVQVFSIAIIWGINTDFNFDCCHSN